MDDNRKYATWNSPIPPEEEDQDYTARAAYNYNTITHEVVKTPEGAPQAPRKRKSENKAKSPTSSPPATEKIPTSKPQTSPIEISEVADQDKEKRIAGDLNKVTFDPNFFEKMEEDELATERTKKVARGIGEIKEEEEEVVSKSPTKEA
uniref:Uncharacterized protein n=1 Tax=Cannabis sativa TaxID=3483 RepID=A0A803PE45_CANSA